MSKPFSIFTILFLLILSCKKDSDTNYIKSFPLAVNNEWQYESTWETTDQASGKIEKSGHTERWKIVSDTSIAGELTYKLLISFSADNSNGIGIRYYQNKSNGLFLVGTDSVNYGSTMLFSEKTASARKAKKATTLAYWKVEKPVHLMKFPVKMNEKWISNSLGDERKWIGMEEITTPAGSFMCTKLEVIFPFENTAPAGSKPVTYKLIQYFSEKGLVKEEYTSNNGRTNEGKQIDFKHITYLTKVNF